MLPPIRPTYLMCSQYAWTTCSRKFTSFFILPTDPRFTIELVTFSTFVPWASFRWCINQMLWLVLWWRVISGQMRISSGIGNCTFTPGMFIHILWLCPSKPPAAAAKETNYHICCEARTSSRSCDNSRYLDCQLLCQQHFVQMYRPSLHRTYKLIELSNVNILSSEQIFRNPLLFQ